MLQSGGRGPYSAADSLPINIATAATSGRTNSTDGTTTSSEVGKVECQSAENSHIPATMQRDPPLVLWHAL